MDEFERPSSRSTPDSTDFEKIEKEDVMEAPSGFEPDSSTHLEDALRGGGDAPRIKLESPTASVSGPPTPVDDQGDFHDQGFGISEKMTIIKSHFSHDIFTQMAPLGPKKTISTLT